jgi:hypothetical protein
MCEFAGVSRISNIDDAGAVRRLYMANIGYILTHDDLPAAGTIVVAHDPDTLGCRH